MSMEVPQYVPREERRAGGAKFDVPDGEYWCKIVSAGEETVKNTSERVLVRGRILHINNLRRLEAKGRVIAQRARAERASIAGWLKHSSQRRKLSALLIPKEA